MPNVASGLTDADVGSRIPTVNFSDDCSVLGTVTHGERAYEIKSNIPCEGHTPDWLPLPTVMPLLAGKPFQDWAAGTSRPEASR